MENYYHEDVICFYLFTSESCKFPLHLCLVLQNRDEGQDTVSGEVGAFWELASISRHGTVPVLLLLRSALTAF